MRALTVHTTPDQKSLYSVKTFRGHAFPLPYHNHSRFELTYIQRGRGMRFVGDHVGEYHDGDVVLMAPYLAHQWQSHQSGSRKKVLAISVFFEQTFPSVDLINLIEFKPVELLKGLAKQGVELRGNLRKEVACKIRQLNQWDDLNRLLQVVLILNQIAQSGEYNLLSRSEELSGNALSSERINRITHYIYHNLDRKICLHEIGEVACMHPAGVGRFFRKWTGFTLVAYINAVRIGKACRMLDETSQPINSIAYQCGFSNLSYFNRCFKRLKGIKPGQYRKFVF